MRFRVWDAISRKFSYPTDKVFSVRSDGCLIGPQGPCDNMYKAHRQLDYKDISGKDIFEGDILRYSALGHTFQEKVAWEHFGWTTQSKTGKFANPFSSLDYEVVGNVMEHPHLLPND